MGQGVGVGIVNPILFSLVADMTIESERGTAYGILCFTQSMGGTVGGWLSTVISAHSSVQPRIEVRNSSEFGRER